MFAAVYFVSSIDGWIVGYDINGDGVMLHYDGDSWNEVSNPIEGSLSSICFTSPTDGWAVGKEIVHWDGNEWSAV
ncbi:MAG: hypothetical protein QMD71_02800 [bacterium]|nr:hypothetical protein [bacterium]